MIGRREPRVRVEPPRAGSHGADAAMLMAEYGQPLDPWQRDVLDCWLGVDEQGEYTVTSAGLSVPRQNGKNFCLEALELFATTVRGERIIHSAHQVRTTKKAFRRLESIFTDRRHPELEGIVRTIRYTNGEEAIELWNGGGVEYISRSRQAGRGYEGISKVVFDEAQELTDEQLEATMATLAASATGTRQLFYAGTPPYPGCPGTVFRRRRAACLTEPTGHASWHEWSVEAAAVTDIKREDPALWYATNPALGLHLTLDFTAEELDSLSTDGFCRERLGWWSPVLEAVSDAAIDPALWEACRSEAPKPEGKTAYGVRFSPDGTEVCLCGAACPEDGPARISLIQRQPSVLGVRWLADWLCQRYDKACCVVIDGKNGCDVLIERIRDVWKHKQSIIRARPADVIAATSQLVAELGEKTVTWYGPQEAMRDSALGSTKRPLSGGWAFGGEDPGPIHAAALALWGARTSKREPGKVMRIG